MAWETIVSAAADLFVKNGCDPSQNLRVEELENVEVSRLVYLVSCKTR
jgi:hypothetical protein